jgi:hypothetical protein
MSEERGESEPLKNKSYQSFTKVAQILPAVIVVAKDNPLSDVELAAIIGTKNPIVVRGEIK